MKQNGALSEVKYQNFVWGGEARIIFAHVEHASIEVYLENI